MKKPALSPVCTEAAAEILQMILILTIIGFLGFAGIHRMVLNQIGMGILYFFTGGHYASIGTIIDLVNYRSWRLEYNQKVAHEISLIVK